MEIVGCSWFEGSGLTKITVPSSVREFGARAFANCKKLQDIVFQDNGTLWKIG